MFVAQILPAWCLGVEKFGVFSWLVSVLTVLTFFCAWGTDRFCLKQFSLQSRSGEMAQCERTLFSTYLLIGVNSLVLAIGFAYYLKVQLPTEYSLLLVGACVFVFSSRTFAFVTSSITRGLDLVLQSEFYFGAVRPLVFVVLMAIVYVSGMLISLTGVLLLLAVSFLVSFVALYLTNYRTKGLAPKIAWQETPTLYKSSFFFFVIGVGMPLLANINTIQLGAIRPSEEVALFAAAVKLVNLVLLALVSANLLIAPKLSPLFYSGDLSGMKSLIRGNNGFVAVLTGVPVIAILLFAEPILRVFGQKYIAAAPFLRMLVVGQACSVACGPVILTATLSGLQNITAGLVLVVCLVNWSLCILLIPSLGVMGAVYASVISNVLVNGGLALIIYVKTGLNVTMLNLVR